MTKYYARSWHAFTIAANFAIRSPPRLQDDTDGQDDERGEALYDALHAHLIKMTLWSPAHFPF